MQNQRGVRFLSRTAEPTVMAIGDMETADGRVIRRADTGFVPSHHFVQRLALIASFLAVDHHPDAVWLSLFAVALNLLWAYRFERSTATARHPAFAGRQRAARLGVNRYPLEQTRTVIATTNAAEAHLAALGDKDILWTADGRAFLMYARQGGRLIALFDPVGPLECWRGLFADFVSLAAELGCKPVFYQVSSRFLQQGEARRMRAFKLGERADVAVDRFSMNGKEWASLRRALNRAERDGLAFEYLEAGAGTAIIEELRQVSDAWLAMNKAGEKRFSLGAFNEDYIRSFPLAVIRLDGRVIAFVNILPAGDSAFIDLMRFVPGIHRGAMDLLVVRVIEWLRDNGFSRLNLGMAPLSGLARRPDAPLWDRIGCLLFDRANRFYNFRGLRAFKEKFDPEWKPRYLVVLDNGSAPLSAAAAAILIAGGIGRVFAR